MYFDLFLPFPIAEIEQTKKKKDKGKGKATQNGQSSSAEQSKTCWDGLRSEEKDAFARDIALAGHRRSISANTIILVMLIIQWGTL